MVLIFSYICPSSVVQKKGRAATRSQPIYPQHVLLAWLVLVDSRKSLIPPTRREPPLPPLGADLRWGPEVVLSLVLWMLKLEFSAAAWESS